MTKEDRAPDDQPTAEELREAQELAGLLGEGDPDAVTSAEVQELAALSVLLTSRGLELDARSSTRVRSGLMARAARRRRSKLIRLWPVALPAAAAALLSFWWARDGANGPPDRHELAAGTKDEASHAHAIPEGALVTPASDLEKLVAIQALALSERADRGVTAHTQRDLTSAWKGYRNRLLLEMERP